MNSKGVDFLLVEDNPDHVELIVKALQDNNVLNKVHFAIPIYCAGYFCLFFQVFCYDWIVSKNRKTFQ